MNWQFTPYSIPMFLSALLSGGLAYYAWKRRPASGATPFALLMLTIAISSFYLCINYRPYYLRYILRLTHHLIHWSMLEVYMVSLMVAIFKLMNYSDLFLGLGFYFFIALLIVNMSVISHYNAHDFWESYLDE